MKNKTFKLLISFFSLLLVFSLASCGREKYDDTLNADPFKQLNESVDELKNTLSFEADTDAEGTFDFINKLNFSINNIRTDFDDDYEIEEGIFVNDGVVYISKVADTDNYDEDPKNYAAKFYDETIVLYELLGDGVAERNYLLMTSTSDTVKYSDIIDAFKIYEEDLKDTEDIDIYSLKTSYFNDITKAVKSCGIGDISGLFSGKKIIVDVSKYAEEHKIIFADEENKEKSLLTLSISKLKGVQTLSIVLESEADSTTVELKFQTKSGELFSVSLDATHKREKISAEFSISEEKSDIKNTQKYSLKLTCDIDVSELELEMGASVLLYENKQGELVKLDIDADVIAYDEEILFADITFDSRLMKKKGKESLSAVFRLNEFDANDFVDNVNFKIDESINVEAKLKTVSASKSSSQHQLNFDVTKEDETKKTSATLNMPALNPPLLTEKEKSAIEAGAKIYNDPKTYIDKATQISQEATTAIKTNQLDPKVSGLKFYTEDKRTGAFYFTDIELVNGQYQATTRLVADYERYLPIYARNADDFYVIEPSLASLELTKIINQLEDSERSQDFTYSEKTFKSFIYLEEFGFYAIMQGTSVPSVTFTTEKQVAYSYPYYVMHEIRKTEQGYAVHNYEAEIDDDCRMKYICKECQSVKRSVEHYHDYEEAESGSAESANGKLFICKRCNDIRLESTDSEGRKVTFSLIPASRVNLDEVNSCSIVNEYKMSELRNCLFVNGIDYDNDGQTAHVIEIPQIEAYGYKIIGVNTGFAYEKNLENLELILPEGTELIMKEAFLASNLDKLVVPDSVVYIGDNAFKSSLVSEIVIDGAQYIHFTAFQSMPNLRKIFVNAESLESFPELNAPNLEIIEFEHSPKDFFGFSSCKITEYEIPEGVENVFGFNENKTLKKLVLPSTAKTLSGLPYCTSLEELVLNNGLENVRSFSVIGCTNLNRIWVWDCGERPEEGVAIFPEGLKNIDEHSFTDLIKIKEATFLSGGLSISPYCFSSAALQNVRFEGACGNIHINSFADEITYCGEINGVISFGKVTNIYSNELYKLEHSQYISSDVAEINFAGSESEFAAAGYLLSSNETIVNYNVAFGLE